MDRNHIIGFLLIFVLFYAWVVLNAPSPEEVAEQKRIQDSIARVEVIDQSEIPDQIKEETPVENPTTPEISDSSKFLQLNYALGPFAQSGMGEEKSFSLKNDVFKVTFSNKGGRPVSIELFNYDKIYQEDDKEKKKAPLLLFEDEKNKFEYLLPVTTSAGNIVKTSDLIFEPVVDGKTIRFRAYAGQGKYFEQRYEIKDGSFDIDYDVTMVGLHQVFQPQAQEIQFNWENHLDRIELNTNFEKFYSTVYFKPQDEDSDYCSCRGDDEESLPDQKIKWASHANQFFNTSIIAKDRLFNSGEFTTVMVEDESDDMKLVTSNLAIPFGQTGNETFSMNIFSGPNEFDMLKSYDAGLEQIVPFGRSIFGTINRYVIRPLFDFIFGKVGSAGLAIIIMITLVKFLLYPLMYKMLHSQAKMAALKPELAHLKEKYKDDNQKVQMETMKIYREFGVSPLGGCLPMVVQIPIWYALFRFFPAYIDFRQESFLWADDLSSYDVLFYLPFEIPMFGAHVSLFTLLWAVTTIIYTYYNTKHMDMSAQPMMKYIQYAMPVMFLVFFNNYASGLTIYMFFSNLINIIQTIGTKKWIFNEEKIKEELYKNKAKPKKKSKFQQRLEEAMKQQQLQQQKNKRKR